MATPSPGGNPGAPGHPLPEGEGAFSLIEVLLAMAILAVGLISIASIFPVAAYQQRQSVDDAQGVIVGHNVLAMIRSYAANQSYSYFLDPNNNPQTPTASGDTLFHLPACEVNDVYYSSTPPFGVLGSPPALHTACLRLPPRSMSIPAASTVIKSPGGN